MGIFIEHFRSRKDFEEWLSAAASAVRVRNVSMTTGRAPVERGDDAVTYAVTYEADEPFRQGGGSSM